MNKYMNKKTKPTYLQPNIEQESKYSTTTTTKTTTTTATTTTTTSTRASNEIILSDGTTATLPDQGKIFYVTYLVTLLLFISVGVSI